MSLNIDNDNSSRKRLLNTLVEYIHASLFRYLVIRTIDKISPSSKKSNGLNECWHPLFVAKVDSNHRRVFGDGRCSMMDMMMSRTKNV